MESLNKYCTSSCSLVTSTPVHWSPNWKKGGRWEQHHSTVAGKLHLNPLAGAGSSLVGYERTKATQTLTDPLLFVSTPVVRSVGLQICLDSPVDTALGQSLDLGQGPPREWLWSLVSNTSQGYTTLSQDQTTTSRRSIVGEVVG